MLLYTQVIGDPQQKRLFEDVYAAYRGRMLALARRRLRTPEDAEDAVHQAFLSLAEHFHRLARLPRPELEAYLTVVVERKCIDLLRQQARLSGTPFDETLPLVTPPVEIDGHKYVDGGVADSVPIEHVLEEAGFDRAVVIVTQDRSYEKKPYEFLPAARARYADYPYLLEAIETRHDRYNIQRMHLWKYEREGRALVVAPQKPVEVGHMEHDTAKLLDLYIQGRQEAKRLLVEIQQFVER